MQSIANFVKLTVIGGALVLLPLVGCIYLLVLVVETVVKAIKPVTELLPVEKFGGVGVALIVAIAAIVAVCFLLGLFVPTALGQGLGRWLESKVLNLLPGYSVARRIARQLSGNSNESLGAPVLVRLGESRQFGFLVDEHPSGDLCVFVPLAPVLSMGEIHIVNATTVERLTAPVTGVVNCVTSCGIGSLALLPAPKTTPQSPPGSHTPPATS